ncbi:MAG: hypothetical protein JW882_02250 [Deltaproteobacteria bacterium]|nr:hypothetical protein [Deltaproteobacteria bacterium]
MGGGFFGPGEGEDWFKEGTIEPGGRLPVNSSGGLLSEAYFMGLSPLSEGAMQIMGRCGQRQLGPGTGNKMPEIIMCSVTAPYSRPILAPCWGDCDRS